MTKRAAILRAVLIGLGVVCAAVAADAVLSRTHLTWLAWVVDGYTASDGFPFTPAWSGDTGNRGAGSRDPEAKLASSTAT